MFGKIIAVVDSGNVAGARFAIWHKWDPEGMPVWECGIPVSKAGESSGNVVARELEATNAITATHLGAYETSKPTHDAIDAYIQENGLTVTGAPWEVYVSDPSTEPDTAKWQTDIFYPVE